MINKSAEDVDSTLNEMSVASESFVEKGMRWEKSRSPSCNSFRRDFLPRSYDSSSLLKQQRKDAAITMDAEKCLNQGVHR